MQIGSERRWFWSMYFKAPKKLKFHLNIQNVKQIAKLFAIFLKAFYNNNKNKKKISNLETGI